MEKHYYSRKNNFQVLWNTYFKNRKPNQADIWLTKYFRENKKFGSKDRRFYRDNFFKILRSHGLILMQHDLEKARATFAAITNNEKLFSYMTDLDLDFYLTKTESLTKENISHQLDRIDHRNIVDLAIATSTDIETANRFLSRIETSYTGKEMQYLLNLALQPKAWIRIDQPQKISNLKIELSQKKIDIFEANGYYYFIQNPQLKNLHSYQKGIFDFQDLASQSLTTGLPKNFKPQTIWDACAGGGGKSFVLNQLYPNAKIFSSDIRSYKLDNISKKSKTLNIDKIKTFNHDATKQLPQEYLPSSQPFDLVIVDAPCTSSGTTRRSPDTVLRLSNNVIGELVNLQSKILEIASDSVGLGGFLIYSTCSIFIEENESMVNNFLKMKPNFKIYSQEMVGSPETDSDSMFKAILQRI